MISKCKDCQVHDGNQIFDNTKYNEVNFHLSATDINSKKPTSILPEKGAIIVMIKNLRFMFALY